MTRLTGSLKQLIQHPVMASLVEHRGSFRKLSFTGAGRIPLHSRLYVSDDGGTARSMMRVAQREPSFVPPQNAHGLCCGQAFSSKGCIWTLLLPSNANGSISLGTIGRRKRKIVVDLGSCTAFLNHQNSICQRTCDTSEISSVFSTRSNSPMTMLCTPYDQAKAGIDCNP